MTRPVRDCLAPGCGPKPIRGRGYCSLHYGRLRTYGDALAEPQRQPATCTVHGCDKPKCAKRMCQMHYLRVRQHGDPHVGERYYSTGRCEVNGCDTVPRGRYCRAHAGRLQRTGTTDAPKRAHRKTVQRGYQLIKSPGHPLRQKSGWLYEHRAVLYDAIGEGPHPCHWCRKPVDWHAPRQGDFLVVDHLDNDTGNNARENLAPSCDRCNKVDSYIRVRVTPSLWVDRPLQVCERKPR